MKKPLITLHTLKKENVFQIPFQYFEQLPAEVQQKIALMNGYEMAKLAKENVFNVPLAYFETLPLEVQQKLTQANVFANSPQQAPFEVPAQFFEGLSQKIQQKVSPKAIENIEKVNVFQTPTQYFEWLPAKIQARIRTNEQQTAPTIFPKWAKGYQLTGYLALGALSLWLVLGIFSQKTLEKPIEQQTQTAQNNEAVKEDKQSQYPTDTLSNKVEIEEIEPIKAIKKEEKLDNIAQKQYVATKKNNQETKTLRMIDVEIEQLTPQDILNYLSYTAISDNLLLDLLLEEGQTSSEEAEEIIMALNDVLEEDIYEEIHHEELQELNQLLKETK